MEAPAAGEREDRASDDPAIFRNGIEGGLEIVNLDYRKRGGKRVVTLAVEAKIDVAAGRRGIVRTKVCEFPPERLGVKAAGQFMRRQARQFDIIYSCHVRLNNAGSGRRGGPGSSLVRDDSAALHNGDWRDPA